MPFGSNCLDHATDRSCFILLASSAIAPSITRASRHPLAPFRSAFCSNGKIPRSRACSISTPARVAVISLYVVFRHVIGLYWSARPVSPSLEISTVLFDYPIRHLFFAVHNGPHFFFEEGVRLWESLVPEAMDFVRPQGFPARHFLYCLAPPAIPTYWWVIRRPDTCPMFLNIPFPPFQCGVPRVMLASLSSQIPPPPRAHLSRPHWRAPCILSFPFVWV